MSCVCLSNVLCTMGAKMQLPSDKATGQVVRYKHILINHLYCIMYHDGVIQLASLDATLLSTTV